MTIGNHQRRPEPLTSVPVVVAGLCLATASAAMLGWIASVRSYLNDFTAANAELLLPYETLVARHGGQLIVGAIVCTLIGLVPILTASERQPSVRPISRGKHRARRRSH